MADLVGQLPALVGVVVGAVGSYLAVALGDRARFRRERVARWEERRLAAYSGYAASAKAVISLTWRISAHLGNDPHPHPLTPREAAPLLGDATASRDLTWETILLLAPPDVLEAAKAWAAAVLEMERFVARETRDPAAWSALLARQRDAREAFYAAARRDVSMP